MRIKSSFLVLSLVALSAGIPPLPEPVNLTRYRIKTAATCEKYTCAEGWISDDQSAADVSALTNERCPGHNWSSWDNSSMAWFSSGLVDWKYLHAIFDYQSRYFCPNCGFTGPFSFYVPFIKFQLAVASARSQGLYCSAPFTVDYCRWWSYMMSFRVYFSYFAIPATLVTSYINLSTLDKMLTNDAGTALYFHKAEVIVEALYNLVLNCHYSLLVFSSVDRWIKACQFRQIASFFQSAGVVFRYLGLMNQAFLAAVIADRLYALTKPVHYRAGDKKKRGKRSILLIFLSGTLLHVPFLLWRLFYPLRAYWATKSGWWATYHHPIDLVLLTFYLSLSVACVMFQAVCSFIFERKFRGFINTSAGQNESPEQLKRQERDKRLLLAGTVGLNLATTAVSNLLYIAYSTALYDIFELDRHTFWQRNLAKMLEPVLSFINGSGALVFHLVLVKSYRLAFKSTKLGRMLCGEQPATPQATRTTMKKATAGSRREKPESLVLP